MKKTTFLTKCLSLFVLAIILTGCAATNTRLGIPQDEWNQYSYEQKEALQEAYRQAQQRRKIFAAKPGEGVLQVEVQGGTMLLPPYDRQVAYQPLSFTLKQGRCYQDIDVASQDSSKTGKLKVCYTNDTLYFDPSPYDETYSAGSLQFPYMAIWRRGFTYNNVSGTGLLKLTNVSVSVQQVVSAN